MTTFSAFDDRDRFEQYLRDHYTAIVGRAGRSLDCPLQHFATSLGIDRASVGVILLYIDPLSKVERSDPLVKWQRDFVRALDNYAIERYREGGFAAAVFIGKAALAVLQSIPKE